MPIHGDMVDMQKIFALDSVAQFIWDQLDGKTQMKDICHGILASFDVDRNQAERDLKEFISELLDARLIEAVRRPPAAIDAREEGP